jgi:glycosyltransferase involved in cell wall biosynthesis
MTKPKLSVVLATYNESKNLPECLRAVKQIADEICIVDGKSQDNTVAIARKFGARVKLTTNKPNFHINKNMAIDMARGEWILQLDADEVVSPALLAKIRSIISAKDGPNGYWLPRLNYFMGVPLTKGGQYPDYTLRLYRNGLGRLPGVDVHEQATVQGQVAYLTENLLHYNTPDFENYLLRHNRYTSLIATKLHSEGVRLDSKSAVDYVIIKPFVEFVKLYFRHKGLVDGFPGFVFALFSGLRFPLAYIKYWQQTGYPAKL